MRTAFVLFSLLLFSTISQAQSAAAAQAAQAAQQAAQAAQQANDKAIADMQHAMDQATLANQQAMANLNNAANTASVSTGPLIGLTAKPKISVKPGPQKSLITIKLSVSTRGAIMYYTTNGWTPTAASHRYVGPISIDSTTNFQAVAIAPYHARSLVASAVYTFPAAGSSADQVSDTVPPNPACVPVQLLFAQDVSSRTAEIGDKVLLTLADDLTVSGAVIAPKGASATVTVIQVMKTGAGGAPGEIDFQADPLPTTLGLVNLRGAAALEGEIKLPNAAVLIPVVGPLTLFRHGKDADIKSGTPFTAYLDTTTLTATK
ncbi:MAG TPA: chitobiase/beta-hexosaminidase C-terminal domain-containing protein [Candidatus Acidoferrum sp.]